MIRQPLLASRRSLIKGTAAVTALSIPKMLGATSHGSLGFGPMLGLVELPSTAAQVFMQQLTLQGSPVLALDGDLATLLVRVILPHTALPSARLSGVTSGSMAFIMAALLQDRGFNLSSARQIDANCRLGTGITCLRQLNGEQAIYWTLTKSGVNFRF